MFAYQLSSLVPAFKFLTSMTEEFKESSTVHKNVNKNDFVQYLNDFKYACNETIQIILLKLNDKLSNNTQCYSSGFDLDNWVSEWHKVFVSVGESSKIQMKELDILHYSIRKLDMIFIKLNLHDREHMPGIKEFIDVFSTVRYIIYNDDEEVDIELKNLEHNINVYTRIYKALESPRDFGEEYFMDNDSRIHFEEEYPLWITQEWNNKSEETILEELDSELYDMMRERTNYFLAKDAVENKKHMLINIGGVKPTYIKPLSVGKHSMEYLR